jgi:hypothetical protein
MPTVSETMTAWLEACQPGQPTSPTQVFERYEPPTPVVEF